MLNKIKNLDSMGYFAAPASAQVTPAIVPDNIECIEILTDGKIYFETGGVEKEYERGAVFWHLSRENTIWKTSPEAPYCCVVFKFAVSAISRTAPEVSYWPLPEEGAEFAERCLKRFHAGVKDSGLFTLYTYSTLLWNATNQNVAMPLPPALQNALAYIRKQWNKPIEAADIAESSNISKPYLFKMFREHLQCSPYKYVLNQRINNAKFMLANKDKSIKEISASCGFSSIEVFYRQFKNLVKISPAEYRNNFLPYNFK